MSFCVTVCSREGETVLQAEKGQLISDLLKAAGMVAVFPCGGNGKCGRCRVQAQGLLEEPTSTELEMLGDDYAKGIRLACMCRVTGDCRIVLSASDIEAVTQGYFPVYEKKPLYARCGAAVDIGTTTIAAQLWVGDEMVAEASALNPQATFGADVISRIEAALAGRLGELQQTVASAIEKMLTAMGEKAGCYPEVAVITGNTAMLHFLAGEDPAPLSAAPFAARRLFGEWLSADAVKIGGKLTGTRFYLAPCFSAFVGGDIATAILASELVKKQQTALLVDIGTNGEMALLKDGKLICCSTAAGPVFEGAQISCGMQGKAGAIDHVTVEDGQLRCTTIKNEKAAGICGSGLVDAVAALVQLELVEESGYMEDDVELAEGVTLTPQDIRMVQLAKGAICAGIRTLCDAAKIDAEDITTLYIAGGFGAKLDIASAAAIGMIPEELACKARVIGNAALAGAAMLLRSEPLAEQCNRFIREAEIIELSSNPTFSSHYMDAMMF